MAPAHRSHLLRVTGALIVFLISMTGGSVRPALTEHGWADQPNGRLGAQEMQAAPAGWTASQTEQPAVLAKELSNGKAHKPFVICVGFRDKYNQAHISGAPFYGPGSTNQGVADLKKWAQNVARTKPIVIYCGCCPMVHCPNIRPAFEALREMGFQQVKVLDIENDFPTDWVKKGYPTEHAK